MLKAELPFLTEQLTIATPDKLTDLAWEEIITGVIDQIDAAEVQLSTAGIRNHITRLNDADIGIEVVIEPELAAYIDVCMKSFMMSQGIVRCFKYEGSPDQLSQFFTLQVTATEAFVIKHQEIEFNPRLLLPYYLFDQLDTLLRGAKLHNYILSIHNLKLARGEDNWEIEFDHPLYDPAQPTEMNSIVMTINNLAVFLEPALFHATDSDEEDLPSPFSHKPHAPQIAGVIVECENATTAKVLGQIAATQNYNFEFQRLANEWEAGITVIDLDGAVTPYTSSTKLS